jgi:hypothetical protein
MVCCDATEGTNRRNKGNKNVNPPKTVQVPRATLLAIRRVIRHVSTADPQVQNEVIKADETLSKLLDKRD